MLHDGNRHIGPKTASSYRARWYRLSDVTCPPLTRGQIAAMRRRKFLSSSELLMLAVLVEAIKCWQGDGLCAHEYETPAALAAEAREWLFNEEADGLFSSNTVFLTLGYNPRAFRPALLAWRRGGGRIGGEVESIRDTRNEIHANALVAAEKARARNRAAEERFQHRRDSDAGALHAAAGFPDFGVAGEAAGEASSGVRDVRSERSEQLKVKSECSERE